MPVAFTALLQAMTYLVKNPPAHPLWQQHGQRAYDKLQELLPLALNMCATAHVMMGVTLILSLFSRQREVVRRSHTVCPDMHSLG